MGLRMNLTSTTLKFDGWDIDMMISAVDERLKEIAESCEKFGDRIPMMELWEWYWHLAENLHEGANAIQAEIDARENP